MSGLPNGDILASSLTHRKYDRKDPSHLPSSMCKNQRTKKKTKSASDAGDKHGDTTNGGGGVGQKRKLKWKVVQKISQSV